MTIKRYVEFTQAGFEELQKRHKQLHEERKLAVENLAIARAMGDLSENAAYTAARRKLSSVDYQIRSASRLLSQARIIETPTNGSIGLGSTVRLKTPSGEQTFQIVGTAESDLYNGKLSQFSPLGKALMGKNAGSTVQVYAPAGKMEYTITEVS